MDDETAGSMRGRTVLVTGGNSGIGLETVVGLAGLGADVTIAVRNQAKGEAAAAEAERRAGRPVQVRNLDLASFESIRTFAEAYLAATPRLDVLVNNAGVVMSQRTETAEGFETTFGVNHLGHFLLTDLLLNRLKASTPARVVVLSSDAHRAAFRGLDFDDLQAEKRYWGMAVYCRSKLANLYFARSLATRLEGTGVTVNAVHPGTVRTNLGQEGDTTFAGKATALLGRFLSSPAAGAATSIHVATAPEAGEVAGRYFANQKETEPARIGRDDAAAERLWAASEALVGTAGA